MIEYFLFGLHRFQRNTFFNSDFQRKQKMLDGENRVMSLYGVAKEMTGGMIYEQS